MTTHNLHYAYYYLSLSILSTLLFTCTALDLWPLDKLTTMQSTGIIVILFTLVTLIQSINSN